MTKICPKFTISIACYQCAPYLPMALTSVRQQTFGDFEVICYVEESTDDSLSICQAVASQDKRFRVVEAPVSGSASTTRNDAIDHAKGEYLVFLDGDDWVAPNMLERLVAFQAEHPGLDVLTFAAMRTKLQPGEEGEWGRLQGCKISNFLPSDAGIVFSGQEAICRSGKKGNFFGAFTWLSIYRVQFLRENHIRLKEGMVMEDCESTPRIWFFAKRFAYLDEILYAYRERPRSILTGSLRICQDWVKQIQSLMKFAAENIVPPEVLAVWSNQWLTTFFWLYFQPFNSRGLTDTDRRWALQTLFSGEGRRLFPWLVSKANLPKRLSCPFLWLGRKWVFPAKFYFQKIYYPLADLRGKHKAKP